MYLGGASEAVSLQTISLVTDIPISDLYGALRRHWATIPRGLRPTKRCGRCKEERAIKDFGRNRWTKDGLAHYCRTCRRLQRRRAT